MRSHTLFCSANVQEVYLVYQTLNDAFLKAHKHQAEFRISTITSGKDFCLNVEDATETERKWLEEATLQILEKKFEKPVDEK